MIDSGYFFLTMAQPSVADYFNNRKRLIVDDYNKVDRPQKILKLDKNTEFTDGSNINDTTKQRNLTFESNRESCNGSMKVSCLKSQKKIKKDVQILKTKKLEGSGQSIHNFVANMKIPKRCVTPPSNYKKETDHELDEIKEKICQSSKLNHLIQSVNNFKQLSQQLDVVEKRTTKVSQSPKLASFKSIAFDVTVSPQKSQSPEKPYLSPKKESNVRKNLLNIPAFTQQSLGKYNNTEISDNTIKQSLKLPFKYRNLAEIFRALDIVTQILHNRKEIITLQKVKPAVEEIQKRNLTQKHLEQIKCIYPEAYGYRLEKLKQFRNGMRHEEWNLVLIPNIGTLENMTPDILLNRRRKFYEKLIELVKNYHNEFLLSLNPPMIIEKDKITRWHPEFDLEKIPDIQQSTLPQIPREEKLFATGKEVLERARYLFHCNTRMEQALAKLNHETVHPQEEKFIQQSTILKGVPKALLEKVRQKQAAKALVSMTRSVEKEKEIQIYSRLPELARLIRNLFVSEKKCVLQLDTVVEKLGNSYPCFLSKIEIEDHLKAISNVESKWLEFYKKRNSVFLKLSKNTDLNVVINRLEKLAKEKCEL